MIILWNLHIAGLNFQAGYATVYPSIESEYIFKGLTLLLLSDHFYAHKMQKSVAIVLRH